jgi:hypothetical protein
MKLTKKLAAAFAAIVLTLLVAATPAFANSGITYGNITSKNASVINIRNSAYQTGSWSIPGGTRIHGGPFDGARWSDAQGSIKANATAGVYLKTSCTLGFWNCQIVVDYVRLYANS